MEGPKTPGTLAKHERLSEDEALDEANRLRVLLRELLSVTKSKDISKKNILAVEKTLDDVRDAVSKEGFLSRALKPLVRNLYHFLDTVSGFEEKPDRSLFGDIRAAESGTWYEGAGAKIKTGQAENVEEYEDMMSGAQQARATERAAHEDSLVSPSAVLREIDRLKDELHKKV